MTERKGTQVTYTVRLTTAEAWMLYDKVAAEVDVLNRAENVAMADVGGRPWRQLQSKLRERLAASGEVSGGD